MNRAERRAAERRMRKNKNLIIRPITIRKTHDGLYFGLSIAGCVLSILWGYLMQSWITYVFAGFMLVYVLNFGMRLFVRRKRFVKK